MRLALQYCISGTNYTSSRSLAAGAAKMASSKQTAGSEPEQEKKAEASADSEKAFEFFWVSVFTAPCTKLVSILKAIGDAEREGSGLRCQNRAVFLHCCTVKLLCLYMTIQT